MDWETIGVGGGSGFIGAVLTLMGWNRRLAKLEEQIEKKPSTDVCSVKHESIETSLKGFQRDLHELKDDVKKLLYYQINGKRPND